MKKTPNLPILQEIHAELSLWQKIKLLAKIYMRQLYELLGLGFQTALDLMGVITTFGYYNPFKTDSPGKIMAEELGKKLLVPDFLVKEGLLNKIVFNPKNRWIRQHSMDAVTLAINNPSRHYAIQDSWEYDLGEAVGVHDLVSFGYCTQNELNHWFIEDLKSGDPNPKAYARTLENRGKGWTTRPQLATYYAGSVTQSSYYVDLRWDTVANGPVDYNGWYESSGKK